MYIILSSVRHALMFSWRTLRPTCCVRLGSSTSTPNWRGRWNLEKFVHTNASFSRPFTGPYSTLLVCGSPITVEISSGYSTCKPRITKITDGEISLTMHETDVDIYLLVSSSASQLRQYRSSAVAKMAAQCCNKSSSENGVGQFRKKWVRLAWRRAAFMLQYVAIVTFF